MKLYIYDDVDYTKKLCIPEEMFEYFFSVEEIEKINTEDLITIKPPMGDAIPPEIIMELGREIFFGIASNVIYDVIKRFFTFLKNKYKNTSFDEKPVLVLELNDYKGVSFRLKANLQKDDCNETLDKISKIVDALKDERW